MPNENVSLNLNLVTSRSAKLEPNVAKRAVTLGFQNVGFRIATRKRDQLAKNIYRDFAPIVEAEMQDMARKVSSMAVGLASQNNPPPGVLSITGRVSQAMIGNSGPMSISSVTGRWAERNPTYMKNKFRKYRTRKWFKSTGQLAKSLSKPSTYYNSYGPLKIVFKPAPFTKASVISSLGRSSGGQSPTAISIGRVEITPLRGIRLSDLPGIGQQAAYSERLMDRLPKTIRVKLSGRQDKYRPVIEPFMSYYLNRRIPNAVYRKLEDSLA